MANARGGGMSPFGATGAQRGALADVKEKIDFSFKQINVDYTFELIDKIDLSPSPITKPTCYYIYSCRLIN